MDEALILRGKKLEEKQRQYPGAKRSKPKENHAPAMTSESDVEVYRQCRCHCSCGTFEKGTALVQIVNWATRHERQPCTASRPTVRGCVADAAAARPLHVSHDRIHGRGIQRAPAAELVVGERAHVARVGARRAMALPSAVLSAAVSRTSG